MESFLISHCNFCFITASFFSSSPGSTFFYFIFLFMPGRHLSLKRNMSRHTARYSAQLNVFIQGTAEQKTTVARGQRFLSAVMKMGGKKIRQAVGLIYLACQGQDPPKWCNMLTPPGGVVRIYPSVDPSTVQFQ